MPSTATVPQAAGTLSGSVTDPQGALVGGAALRVLDAHGVAVAQAKSNGDGRFVLPAVPAGPFTLEITLTGFDALTVTDSLQAGQHLELRPMVLHMATVSITVDAVLSPEDLALEDLHSEEQQRLVGVFPNFFVSYDWHAPALTTKQKYTLAWKNATDPGNLLLVGVTAGVQQATNAFPGYSQGVKGYGRRFGADLGNLVSGTFLGGAVLPSLFHQDPRYFYKGTGTVRQRLFYALSTAVICRGDNGHRQPAFASVLGDLSAGAISNLYYAPEDRQGATLTFENGLLGIAGDAMNNVFQEFILRKLTPKVQSRTDTSRQ